MEKSQLRKKILLSREKVHGAALNEAILSQLTAYLQTTPFRRIGIYWPIRGELNLLPLMERLGVDFQWYLPSIFDSQMHFYGFKTGDRITKDELGVPVPVIGEKVVPELLIVPCLAMDQWGYRLGYGQGWYDRYLSDHTDLWTVGAVAQAFLFETLFHEEHDRALNVIVTENAIQRVGHKCAAN